MSKNMDMSIRVNISQIATSDFPAMVKAAQQYIQAGGQLNQVIEAGATTFANAALLQKAFKEANVDSTIAIQGQIEKTQDYVNYMGEATKAVEQTTVAMNDQAEAIKQNFSVMSNAASNLSPLIQQMGEMKQAATGIEPGVVSINFKGGNFEALQAQIDAVKDAGYGARVSISALITELAGSGEFIAKNAKSLEGLALNINAVDKAATSVKFKVDMGADLEGLVDQFYVLKEAGADLVPTMEANASTYQDVAQKAGLLAEEGMNVKVSLDAVGMSAEETKRALIAFKEAGVDPAKISLQTFDTAAGGTRYTTRALVFDLRMLSFAARTLQRTFAADNEEAAALTGTLDAFAAAATGVVVSANMITKSIYAMSKAMTGEAAKSFALALAGAAPILLALAAALAIAVAAWMLWNNALQNRSGWAAAQNSIDQYTDELKTLERQMKQIRLEQAKLNEETTRYDLLTSQIEYAVALQGYETPEQTQKLEYIQMNAMGANLAGSKLDYQQAIAGRQQMQAEAGIEQAKLDQDKARNELLAEIRDSLRHPVQGMPAANTPIPGYQSGGMVQETGPALVHAGELILNQQQQQSMGGGGVIVHVNFPNANFNSANDARRTVDSAAYVLGQEVRNRIEASRYGVKRP